MFYLDKDNLVANPPVWLADIYKSKLGRGVDLEGAAYWLGVHHGGQTISAIEDGIVNSDEGRAYALAHEKD